MRFAVVCVALALFALGYSQRPAPCVTPEIWSGRFFRADTSRDFFQRAAMVYDAQRERLALIEEEYVSGTDELYKDILLYELKKGYHINLKTNTCEVFDLNDPFQRIAIPKNAKLDGEVYIGTSSIPGAGVEVDMWSGNTTDPVGSYAIVVTDEGCIPVNDQFYSDRTGVVQTFFFDIVIGDVDPGIFSPPSGCKPTK